MTDTQGTGAVSVSATATVSQQLGIGGQGASAVSASALLTVTYALAGTGQVAVNGSASFGAVGRQASSDRRVKTRGLIRR